MTGTLPEGSVERPYHQNPPRMFREVHWGGGSFVVGVNIGFVGEPPHTDLAFLRGAKTWTTVKTLAGDLIIYDNRAGAYGKPNNTPTFVLGGLEWLLIDLGRFFAWIEITTDGGTTWTRSYQSDDGYIVAIVYDETEQVFYAQATANEVPTSSEYIWQVLKSADGGRSWAVVETAPGGPEHNRYASPIMTAAANPIYQDGDGYNCAGGVYGYDKAKKILMAPYPDITVYASERRFVGYQVQIRKENDIGVRTFNYVDIPGMDQIVSVAFAGGMWQVTGSTPDETALIATSTDDGETWATTYSGPGGIAMIVLGATSLTEPAP